MGFCSMTGYTIVRIFRDYAETGKNDRIFDYVSNGCNRDGLAVRTATELIRASACEHRLMIVLSDVKPQDVVRVAVRHDERVDAPDREAQRLSAEVGRDVDLQAEAAGLDVEAAAQARVARIGGRADRAAASDDRDAGRRPRAEDGHLHAGRAHPFQSSVEGRNSGRSGGRSGAGADSRPRRNAIARRNPTVETEAMRLEPP